ncbi:MAG: hypothetical protein AAFR73_05755 [Pseudomonadota bacterium]
MKQTVSLNNVLITLIFVSGFVLAFLGWTAITNNLEIEAQIEAGENGGFLFRAEKK